MAAILLSTGRVKPGRYAAFVSQSAEASKLYQRLGAPPPRLMSAGFAGEAFGTWTFTVECDDLESLGALSDQFAADSDAQAFLLRLQEEASPTTLEQVSLGIEVPLRESKGGRGSVAAVYVVKPHLGGLERTLELGGRVAAFAESQGAVNARTFSLLGAGSGAGLYLTIFEFDSLRTYARVIDSFSTEPEGQAIAATSAGADAPNTIVFEGVYSEMPLG